jgi:hypothetical protein
LAKFDRMTVSTLGLIFFAGISLFLFALRACMQREWYYMQWLGLLDMVDPMMTPELFQKRAARFAAGLAMVSGVSLVAAVLCVYFIVVEFRRLHVPNEGQSRWTKQAGSLELEEKRYREERGRQLDGLLLEYVSKIDTELRKLASVGDFAVLVELNNERIYAIALERELRTDIRLALEPLTGVETHLFPSLGPTTPEVVVEMRRSWTRALGKICQATTGDFLSALERLESEGSREGLEEIRAHILAVQSMCGPPRGSYAMLTLSSRTSKL